MPKTPPAPARLFTGRAYHQRHRRHSRTVTGNRSACEQRHGQCETAYGLVICLGTSVASSVLRHNAILHPSVQTATPPSGLLMAYPDVTYVGSARDPN